MRITGWIFGYLGMILLMIPMRFLKLELYDQVYGTPVNPEP
jgi:hypothetical protein